MADTTTSNDDAESVDQFLARIASLKDKRDREDEERTRKLEEEILQGRRERQARRAERARSLSPSKAAPAASASSTADSNTMASHSIDPPIDLSPSKSASTPTKPLSLQSRDQVESPTPSTSFTATRPLPTPPSGSMPPPTNVSTLSRSGTLSWQQRPSSRDSNSSRPRPLSGGAAALTNGPVAADSQLKSTDDLSRSEIAQSLGGKDASWFRQTSDRGLTSAAYRRNQVESESAPDSFSASRSMRLPGMSREPTAEPERPSTPQRGFEKSGLQNSNDGDSDSDFIKNQFSATTSSERPSKTAFAMPASGAEKLDSPQSRPSDLHPEPDADCIKLLPTIAPASDRSPSPTKGLGGFVQSAMMKRSDSVNKRWSVQQNAGLKRGDSVASNRSTLAAAGTPALGGPARSPTRNSRTLGGDLPSSPLAASRPSSSHGDDFLSSRPTSKSELQQQPKSLHEDAGIAAIERGRSTEISMRRKKSTDDDSMPSSPTKTMEPRRWSPTKASWLESALARPESPKLMSPPVEQPSWKTDLQRSKLAKPGQDDTVGPVPNFDVVNATSLLRSPPLGGHARPLSISGMPEGFTSGIVKKSPAPIPSSKPVVAAQKPAIDLPKKSDPPLVPTSPAVTSAKAETEKDTRIAAAPNLESRESPAVKAAREPPAVKAKPQTPPKTDFRASLKSRQDTSSRDKNTEPEFRAVFGKLKRTQTQNYVAPDELKDNIARGKAGLNVTGGPEKTKRIDEFKESILQKKEAMKAGGGSLHGKPESKTPAVPEKPMTVLPEALAKRQLLGKPKTSSISSLEDKSEKKENGNGLNPAVTEKRGREDKPNVSSKPTRAIVGDSEGAAVIRDFDSLSTGPEATSTKPISLAIKVDLTKQKAPETSQIAARLNPTLAGFLSRSSSPHVRNSNGGAMEASKDADASFSGPARSASEDSSNLTHVTKARAKGPKRRLPKSEPSPAPPPIEAPSQKASETFKKPVPPPGKSEKASSENATGTSRSLASFMKSQTAAGSSANGPDPSSAVTISNKATSSPTKSGYPLIYPVERFDPGQSDETQATQKTRPQPATKSPDLRKVSSPPLGKAKDSNISSKVVSPDRFNIATDEASKNDSSASKVPKNTTPFKSETSGVLPLTPSTTNANSARVPRVEANDSPPKSSTARPLPKPKGLALDFDRATTRRTPKASVSRAEPTPPPEKPTSPNLEKRIQPCVRAMNEFFAQMPKFGDKAEFNTEQILKASVDSSEKIRTLSKQIWEINGDGKQQSMPPQQEHILFEECMYLVTHTYQTSVGSKPTEVYLWSGDGVADAAVEDAQLFCRKVARENNAKLDVVKQGKEPSGFFQALGGIVITRRTKSSAFYMLCGRRHLGHVAFDEVDFDPSSLCSGFPYIVSAKFGKLYLWKGLGSAADELGCARLMGMDLCLTGEMEEIKEGDEPAAFFDSFPRANAGQREQSAERWQVKDSHPTYGCRLYRVEHDRPKSAGFWGRRGSSPPKSSNKALVTEISPFCQKNLDPSHIYILDSYFDIYAFAGAQATSKAPEFVTAAMLAQEMSYLAPSVLDRPVMSTCHAVLGEPPADFTMNFRKWQAAGKAGDSSVLPLDDVIESWH